MAFTVFGLSKQLEIRFTLTISRSQHGGSLTFRWIKTAMSADLLGMRLRNRHFSFARIAAIFFTLVVSLPLQVVVAQDVSSPKTLFRWSLASTNQDDGEHEDKIVTDRPHFSEASNLVGLGRVQLETGYSYFRDSDNGTTVQTHSFGEPLLR